MPAARGLTQKIDRSAVIQDLGKSDLAAGGLRAYLSLETLTRRAWRGPKPADALTADARR
jgi:hypothetical protein